MVTNGPLARGERRWISRAMSSLPVPVSPVMSTEMSVVATFWTFLKTSCMAAHEPMMSPKRICLELLGQEAVVELELVDQQRVADDAATPARRRW